MSTQQPLQPGIWLVVQEISLERTGTIIPKMLRRRQFLHTVGWFYCSLSLPQPCRHTNGWHRQNPATHFCYLDHMSSTVNTIKRIALWARWPYSPDKDSNIYTRHILLIQFLAPPGFCKAQTTAGPTHPALGLKIKVKHLEQISVKSP